MAHAGRRVDAVVGMPMIAPGTPAARGRAAAEWAALRDRLRTVTPQAVGRAVLVGGVVVGAFAVAVATLPAIIPFLFGGVIAYALLPVVDALDRLMPRSLAALLSVVSVVAAVVVVGLIVLPPLANAFVRLAVELPAPEDIEAAIARLQDQVGSMPEGSAAVAVPILTTIATAIRDVAAGASGGLDDVVRAALRAVLATAAALLGLIVLPTWMLTVMGDKHRARNAIDRRLAPWLRNDLWAAVAIVDRAAGAYLRGYVVVAALVGILVYVGLRASSTVGGPTFQEPLALSVLAGATQVIPVIGPLLGFLPALLILVVDSDRALAYIAIYVVARVVGANLLGGRLMERRIGVHPAILVPGVVMLGQLGILWLLLSAPIVGAVADLIRYAHGRLSEPPMPAGVLPRTPAAARATAAARSVAAPASAIPSTYRRPTAPAPIARASASAPAPPTR
jgi:predicted PurR-regulated permease PerM